MPDLTATSPTADDDALADAEAELLADAIIELALLAPGPIRLAALQMTGLLPPPGSQISQETIAAIYGISRKRVRRLEARFLARAKAALTPDHDPESQP
ncbi:hypothetical protein OKA04_04580 [Luteolibacter flavescens]|uniref:RNA polymerase sigma-70 region 4 domain-containing protein n=1 Tax=Luteolibacter flavescens TaxID=1859460 RepID=A0ABT3FKB2_9BACT|nr:hypothetical protein [Luteolibacter flavescens]MCW1883992.1 hypothetical protein [Luteolibacter flavescens]